MNFAHGLAIVLPTKILPLNILFQLDDLAFALAQVLRKANQNILMAEPKASCQPALTGAKPQGFSLTLYNNWLDQAELANAGFKISGFNLPPLAVGPVDLNFCNCYPKGLICNRHHVLPFLLLLS